MKNTVYVSAIVVLSLGLASSLAGTYTLARKNTQLKEALPLRAGEEPRSSRATEAVIVTNVVTTRASDDEYDALLTELDHERARVAELQEQLAGAHSVPARHEVPTARPAVEEQRNRRTDWATRQNEAMERLKQEDPERYEQIQKDRQERHTAVKKTIEDQYSFIYELDTAKMTEAQLENHNALVALLEANWEHMEVLENEEADEEARRNARQGLMRSIRNASELLDTERDVALYQLGRSLGYSDDEAGEFANEIEHVYEMTSVQTYFSALQRRRGEPRGGMNRGGGGGTR